MSLRFPKTLICISVACTPLLLPAQAPVGELYSTLARVRGSVNLASGGTTVLSGSSIEAGEQPASLVLNRGGTLAVCQGTIVAVSSSADGRNLMFSFGSGTIESRYSVTAASDVIVTPDLRFVITGPGEFDLDIGITNSGDTCVRSGRGSTGGVIVNEQMGDGTYQVKPSDFLLFRKGRIANAETNPAGTTCGCPALKEPARQVNLAKKEPTSAPAPAPPTPAPTTSASNEHVVVEAPFVFNSDGTPPPMTSRIMRLRLESNAFAGFFPVVQAPPSPVAAKPAKKGFWHKFKSALFGE